MEFKEIAKRFIWLSVGLLVALSLWQLEVERATVAERVVDTPAGPLSLYTDTAHASGPLVIVTHGFAGSRQMMQYISRDLARAGFTVAAFDFYGHGRNRSRMSADVSRIEGTTMQLVAQTRIVLGAARAETGHTGPVALLGHSMATDIIVRAAQDLPDVAGMVAISMYSDAVTADYPDRLLVISGQWEERLRRVARDAVALVGGVAVEGETVQAGGVVRRAVAVPQTEHVTVLFSAVTLSETRSWLAAAFAVDPRGAAQGQGRFILMVLVGLVILSAPVFRMLPRRADKCNVLTLRQYFLVLLLPAAPAMAAAVLLGGGLFGAAAFGSLFWFFGIWGISALWLLRRVGHRFETPYIAGFGLLLLWGLGLFAVALDRYGAAFLPVGPRGPLMLCLLVATVPFMVVDRVLVHRAPVWRRIAARALPIAGLAACMLVYPQNMGLLFTFLPVMVLFYLAFGTMAHMAARKVGPETAGVAQGIALAWSIAASTPMFVA